MEVVPLSGVIRGPYSGVERDADAARAPGRGQMAGGRALMQVGDQLAEVGQRIQRAKTNVDIAAARREMDVAKDNFNAFSVSNADENKWGEQSQKEIAEAKKRIGAMKLSREAQTALAPELADFEQRFGAEVKHATIKQSVSRLRARTYNLAENLAREGDTERAVTIVRDLARDGAVNDDEARIKIRQLGELATKSIIMRGVNTKPLQEGKILEARNSDDSWSNYDNLDEDDRHAYISLANQTLAHKRYKTAQGLDEEIASTGRVGMMPKIHAELKKGNLLQSQADRLAKKAAGEFSADDQAALGNELWEQVGQLDPKDPKFKLKSMLLRADAAVLDPIVRGPILKDLEQLENPSAGAQRNFGNEYIDTLYSAGTFGDVSVVMGKPDNPASHAAASRERLRLKIALQRFIEQNRDGDQAAFLEKELRDTTTAVGGTSVLNGILGGKQK